MKRVGKRPVRRRLSKDPQVSRMIDEAAQAIVQRAGGHLRLLLLYGSEARGETTPESDIEILALLDGHDPQLERSVSDTVYDVMWDHDFLRLISLHLMALADFEEQAQKNYSFVMNVREKGVILSGTVTDSELAAWKR